jgi:putative methionine-R-sulfoxide reductase with GAF domain
MDKPSSGEGKLLELFEDGKRFTQDLLRENERLRSLVAGLKLEQRDLESRVVRADVPLIQQKVQVLEQEVQQLRQENGALREQFRSVEAENRDFADRYVQVERQNSDLINLYVTSHRLHSTLNYEEVLRILKEIIINMIGTEKFGVYLVQEQRLVLIALEGISQPLGSSLAIGEGSIGRAAASGQLYVAPAETDMRTFTGNPIACIPLKVGEQVMGVIAIFSLLLQKDKFGSIDFELFELLGGHAATAIYVSHLYSASERKRCTLEGFIDLLKADLARDPAPRQG